MPVYLFSYAYVVNNQWNFDSRLYEQLYFDEKDLIKAQKDAALRHDKDVALFSFLIVPIAVSRLDNPRRPKITKT